MNMPETKKTAAGATDANAGKKSAALKSKRIIMFCDLRNSTEILMNFEKGVYHNETGAEYGYEEFIFDVHRTSYEYLYLDHDKTHTEIYGDGLMAIFPEDNTKYIMENIYRLTNRMRDYNERQGAGVTRPSIDVGFGITTGDISMVYYYLDKRNHPIGMGVHEAARIEGKSKFYDARILISEHFFREAESYINEDPRFAWRFIDRVYLKNFEEPISLFELLVDNDPRFGKKLASTPVYAEAYDAYCLGDWDTARKLFLRMHKESGLGTGLVMANRCDLLSQAPANPDWVGVWNLKDK